jgi:hypothetical protein
MSSNAFNELDREYTEREDYLANRAEERSQTWRRERYESDENSSRSFAKNQKRQWIDLEIMEEAAEFERDLFDQLGSK